MQRSDHLIAERAIRILAAILLVLAGTGILLAAQRSAAGPSARADSTVLVAKVDGIIQPVVAGYLADAIEKADRRNAAALVIELNTPGGLLTSTREIVSQMLEAETPIVVYVTPEGARAASAGFFLLMAADFAAMAPGTNTGAAHPVQGSGQEMEGVMAEKVEQDAAAMIRALATEQGRNVELAEAAVVKSRSFTAEEALEHNLIDFMAPSLNAVIREINGQPLGEGAERETIQTAHTSRERLEMSLAQRLLSAIAHPNVAYLLMTLGGLGLYFELANPGAIFPGVLGALCLILGLFGLSVLPVNYAGVALIVLAGILFLVEVKVISYGLLTLAGVVSLVLGSLMLFKSANPALRVSRDLIAGMAITGMVVALTLMVFAIRSHRFKVRTGAEGMVGEHGLARTELAPEGRVFVHGELWSALAETPIAAGTKVQVAAVDGLVLKVKPVEGVPLGATVRSEKGEST